MIVRALCDVYVETAFREKGAVFEYHGKPNKNLQPVPASFRAAAPSKEASGIPEPPVPGKLIETAPSPEQLARRREFEMPTAEADAVRDLIG